MTAADRSMPAGTFESYAEPSGYSFEAFYLTHARRLTATIRLHTGLSVSESEDVTQEAFARVLARWSRLERSKPPTGYLYRVSFRLARRYRSRLLKTEDVQERPGNAPAVSLTHLAVHEALQAMPKRQRQVALLCLVGEFRPEEAAAVLRMRASTARVHLHNARHQLKQLDIH